MDMDIYSMIWDGGWVFCFCFVSCVLFYIDMFDTCA